MTLEHQALLEQAKDWDLWMAVAHAIHDQLACEPRNDVQRIVWDVWAASGVIGNRGFCDHSQDEMAAWAASYEALGLPDAAVAIREAASIMGKLQSDDDDSAEQLVEELEERFYAADGASERAIAGLIREKPKLAFAGIS